MNPAPADHGMPRTAMINWFETISEPSSHDRDLEETSLFMLEELEWLELSNRVEGIHVVPTSLRCAFVQAIAFDLAMFRERLRKFTIYTRAGLTFSDSHPRIPCPRKMVLVPGREIFHFKENKSLPGECGRRNFS
jgi:hypothetical protein